MAKNWRRGNSKKVAVTKNNAIARGLWRDYARLKTWKAVGAEKGVTGGMAFRVAHGYDPKSPAIRSALGLPAYASAPVCPVHGVVHQGRCPRKTFEQRAADYDAWKTRNMPKLLAIVAWAEGKR